MMLYILNLVISNAGIMLSAPQPGEIPLIMYILLVVVFIGVCAPFIVVLVLLIHARKQAAIERKCGSVSRNGSDNGKTG